MTDRLSFWCVVALLVTAAAALLVAGPNWLLTPAIVVILPAVLAALLLARAAWRRWRGQSWALRVGGRPRLGGAGGVLWPAAFLLAWSGARELGAIDARLSQSWCDSSQSTMSLAWQDGTGAPPPPPGYVVDAPAGPLGDAFRDELTRIVHYLPESRHVSVTLACEPPFGGWPLYKCSAVTSKAKAEILVLGGRAGTKGRTTTIEMEVDGQWTVAGIASRRAFHREIGKNLAERMLTSIDKHMAKAFVP